MDLCGLGQKMGSTAMMELLFSNSIAMIWRRVQVIIILVLFLRIKKGIYGLEQTGGVYIYNPAVDVFKRFKIASSEGITLDNWVAEILSDSLDNIWVLIPDQGLFRYKDGKVHHYSLIDKDNLKKIIIRNVFVSMSRAKYG